MSRQPFTLQCAAAMLALLASPLAWAQPAAVDVQHGQSGLLVLSAQNIVVTDNEAGDSRTLEIRVIGDKVTVIRDGKEVPHAQIAEDDGTIVITDEQGKRLHEIRLRLNNDGSRLNILGDANLDSVWQGQIGHLLGQVKGEEPSVMLGVSMSAPGPAIEKHLGLEPGTCTMISGVYQGLPAHQAGFGEYDIIVKVDGKSPADNESIRKILAERKPGDTIAFTVIQEGKQRDVTVELKAYDAVAMAKAKVLGSGTQSQWQLWTQDGSPLRYEWLAKEPRVYFAPERSHIELDKQLQFELLRDFRDGGAPKEKENIDQQLRRLDERMAELEKLLEKLLERRESAR